MNKVEIIYFRLWPDGTWDEEVIECGSRFVPKPVEVLERAYFSLHKSDAIQPVQVKAKVEKHESL